jgi:hypothetical protein
MDAIESGTLKLPIEIKGRRQLPKRFDSIRQDICRRIRSEFHRSGKLSHLMPANSTILGCMDNLHVQVPVPFSLFTRSPNNLQ